MWLCKCDCGNYKAVRSDHLRDGSILSCGCMSEERKHHLVGMKFNKLTVLKELDKVDKYNNKLYLVQCDCGSDPFIISSHALLSNNTKSCGCLHTPHGFSESKHPLYYIWKSFKNRCYNENNKSYKNYGGRGIRVCEEWLHDFKAFYNWSIENGYERDKHLSLDRIDNNGDYEPRNCRWVTMEIQARNRRNNRRLELFGFDLIMTDWSNIVGISRDMIINRLNKLGWNIYETLMIPLHTTRKDFYNNEEYYMENVLYILEDYGLIQEDEQTI